MAFPHPDDDAPSLRASEWALLAFLGLCLLFSVAVTFL
jgi:hypothetical protein